MNHTTEHNQHAVYHSVYVCAKDDKIKCFFVEEAKTIAKHLSDGWKHTATLNTAQWIEYLVNDCGCAHEQFDALLYGHATTI